MGPEARNAQVSLSDAKQKDPDKNKPPPENELLRRKIPLQKPLRFCAALVTCFYFLTGKFPYSTCTCVWSPEGEEQ